MHDYRIAAITLNPKPGNIQANKAAIIEWLEQAGARTSKLALFPELMLTGSCLEDAQNIAIKRDDDAIEDIAQCAEIYDCIAVVGFLERDQNKIYNSQIFLGDGLRYVVRKSQLNEFEKNTLSQGAVPLVKDIDEIPIWCEIGHINPNLQDLKIPRGSQIALLPNHINPQQSKNRPAQENQTLVRDECRRLAKQSQSYIIYTEQVGKISEQINAPGYALIMDPKGNIMVERKSSREGMISATITI